MSDPLVSILIPTYNGERFLRPALQSALTQNYRHVEVLAGDDGSTDRTPEILAAVAATDERVRVIRHERNIGPFENPRQLLAAASGEYVKFLMHDDVLGSDCVRELVRGMQTFPETSMAFSHRVLINEHGRPVDGHTFPKLSDRPGVLDGRQLGAAVLENCDNVIGEPTTVLFRRSAVRPDELWDVDGRSMDVLNDVQLWLLLLSQGPAYYTPRTLSRFRFHAGQNSVNPRYVGRGERDWSRLIDWGTRNGFLTGPEQERRAHARALFIAAGRVGQLIDTPNYGASLEAAYLSLSRLVELGQGATAIGDGGLPERMHAAQRLTRFSQELDVWTREYNCAVAAPSLDPDEIAATVASIREVLHAGVCKRALIAVAHADLDRAVHLVQAALAEGPDVDIEIVPTEDPATLVDDPWLAVGDPGDRWHHGRALAVWTPSRPAPCGHGDDAGRSGGATPR